MGGCNTKQEDIVLSEKDQVEFLNIIKSSLNELDEYTNKLREDEVNYKMERYIFILNCLKEINPILEQLQKGRQCEMKIKLAIEEIFNTVKLNDRNKYNIAIVKLKEYFKE